MLKDTKLIIFVGLLHYDMNISNWTYLALELKIRLISKDMYKIHIYIYISPVILYILVTSVVHAWKYSFSIP
jgi:hypothetical protein